MTITKGESLANKRDSLSFKKRLEYETAKILYEEQEPNVNKYPSWTLAPKRIQLVLGKETTVPDYKGGTKTIRKIEPVYSTDIHKFKERIDEIVASIGEATKDNFCLDLVTKMNITRIRDGLGTIVLKGAACSFKVLKQEDKINLSIRNSLKKDINKYYTEWCKKQSRNLGEAFIYTSNDVLPKKILEEMLLDTSDWEVTIQDLHAARLKADLDRLKK